MSSFLSEDIKMISQGTYGCIFKPGMNCRGEIEEEGYITKIQFDKETTNNEYEMGIHLLNNNDSLTEFNARFAPIVDSCPIDIGDIKKDSIEKCEVIRENSYQNTFYSNKIRYVGKYTLGDYFEAFFQDINKSTFLSTFFDTHLYLLDSLLFMKKKSVIHFDLKENNILMDEKYYVPILIDFGISIRKDQLEKPIDYTKSFFQYYDKYPPWCLEIVLISFIIDGGSVSSIWGGVKLPPSTMPENRGKSKDWSSKKVHLEDLLAIIEHFFKANYLVQMITSERIKTVQKKKWKTWIRKYYKKGGSAIYGKFLVEELMKSWDTWDTFALSVIYFRMSQKFMPNHFLSYRELLVKNILAIPPNRENPEQFSNKLSTFLSEMSISDKKSWITSLRGT